MLLTEEFADEAGEGGPVSIVRIIALFAKEHCTPIPMVMDLPWPFFLALLADMNVRAKEQHDEMKRASAKMRMKQ